MKTTIETAKEQQKLLLPGAPDFHPPRRAWVSARYCTSPTPELSHPCIENSTKFNNRYGKRQLIGAVISNEHSEREISRSAAIKLIAYTREIYSQILYSSIGLYRLVLPVVEMTGTIGRTMFVHPDSYRELEKGIGGGGT